MSRTIRIDAPNAWLRCRVSKRLRKKKLSKGHKTKFCWVCW